MTLQASVLVPVLPGCKWRKRNFDLFRHIIILMRDTGMRNERELYRIRFENLDWGIGEPSNLRA
jgi:hypothetical protein